MIDHRVDIISRALHVFHGRGYCTMGKHEPHLNFMCQDEARAILAALDGKVESSEVREVKPALTLSARQKKGRTTK